MSLTGENKSLLGLAPDDKDSHSPLHVIIQTKISGDPMLHNKGVDHDARDPKNKGQSNKKKFNWTGVITPEVKEQFKCDIPEFCLKNGPHWGEKFRPTRDPAHTCTMHPRDRSYSHETLIKSRAQESFRQDLLPYRDYPWNSKDQDKNEASMPSGQQQEP